MRKCIWPLFVQKQNIYDVHKCGGYKPNSIIQFSFIKNLDPIALEMRVRIGTKSLITVNFAGRKIRIIKNSME